MIFLSRNMYIPFDNIFKFTMALVFAAFIGACGQNDTQNLQQVNTASESATQAAGSLPMQDSQQQLAGPIPSVAEKPVSLSSYQSAAAAANVIFE